MKKLFFLLFLIIALGVAGLFAAGLRVDLEELQAQIENKPDPNAQALLKMGIDPAEVGLKRKPWWTFDPKKNLFRTFQVAGGPPPGASQGSGDTSGITTALAIRAQAAALQAELNQQRAEAIAREAERR
jgi:hypothetical protein